MLEVLLPVLETVFDVAVSVFHGFKIYQWLTELWGWLFEPPESLVDAPMTEKDQEMCARTGQIVREVFGEDIVGAVNEADYNGRVSFASNLVQRLTEEYGVSLSGCELYVDSNISNCGGFVPSDNKIRLNVAYLFTEEPQQIYEFIDTVIHELRHAVQLQAVFSGDLAAEWAVTEETRELWRDNFLNYIKPDQNYKGYIHQPLENDARTFAYHSLKGIRPEKGEKTA